jgi:hypothetical protein
MRPSFTPSMRRSCSQGDFNVVPTHADIYPTKSYAKNALVQHAPEK